MQQPTAWTSYFQENSDTSEIGPCSLLLTLSWCLVGLGAWFVLVVVVALVALDVFGRLWTTQPVL